MPDPVLDLGLDRDLTLRTYTVERQDGSNEIIQAHYTDGGQNPPGHLAFFTVDAEGFQRLTDVFNVHEWRRMADITTPENTMLTSFETAKSADGQQ